MVYARNRRKYGSPGALQTPFRSHVMFLSLNKTGLKSATSNGFSCHPEPQTHGWLYFLDCEDYNLFP